MQFYLFFNTILISFQTNSLHFSLFYRIFGRNHNITRKEINVLFMIYIYLDIFVRDIQSISHSLREKCPYLELFWPTFSYIRTRITPNTDIF